MADNVPEIVGCVVVNIVCLLATLVCVLATLGVTAESLISP
jgi:hypothetical protein